MKDNIIELEYDKLVTNLTGNKLGRAEFKKQIEPKLDYTKLNVIVFPEQIEDVGMSFFQGLYQEIINKFGKNDIESHIQIKSSHIELVEKFNKIISL